MLAAAPLAAELPAADDQGDIWLAAADDGEGQAAPVEDVAEAPKEPPPIPFHSIEGYSGGPITPMAYLCNTGPEGSIFGKPSVSYSFVNLGSKELHSFAVTETFFNRVELGYAFNRLSLGSLVDDLKAAGLDPGLDEVWLHHFNARFLLLPENSFDLELPAVTAGVHFKYNEGVKKIDRKLGGALKGIGFDSDTGVDFTLTASKMFPELAFGRPMIFSAGIRWSKASNLGLLGFGDSYRPTVEANVACLPTDWLVVAYEYRQKRNPYHQINDLIERENDWHALSASIIVNENLTITALYGLFGNVLNGSADCTLAVQAKWEF
jgi:hypothetical protein